MIGKKISVKKMFFWLTSGIVYDTLKLPEKSVKNP